MDTRTKITQMVIIRVIINIKAGSSTVNGT